jgi:hypothetical protein
MAGMSVAGVEVSMRVPYGAIPVWASSGDTLYLGLASSPEVRLVTPAGTAATVRWSQNASELTAAERRLGEQRYLETLAADGNDPSAMPRWSDFPLPRVKPLYFGIQIDGERNLWIQEYPTYSGGFPELISTQVGQEPQRWNVHDFSGKRLGTATMPDGFELHAVSDGVAIGVFRDAVGVESVRAYRLLK